MNTLKIEEAEAVLRPYFGSGCHVAAAILLLLDKGEEIEKEEYAGISVQRVEEVVEDLTRQGKWRVDGDRNE